ncbi:MAG: glutaredoxin [Minisyncoccia bacterium]
MTQITVFSRSLCEPCKTLKGLLHEARISFEEVDITKITDDARKDVVKNILSVSKIDTATVPAVLVERNGELKWFSNHGSCDVTQMFEDIRRELEK